MAIDTAAKRASIRHLGMPWRGPAIVPSGTVDAGERAAFLFMYSGFATAVVPVLTPLSGILSIEPYLTGQLAVNPYLTGILSVED